MPSTLFDKIWADHEVAPGLLYIDLHLVHEVTSPQAFDGLRLNGRTVRRPDRTLATADHKVPPTRRPAPRAGPTPPPPRPNRPPRRPPGRRAHRDELSRVQVETLERNCA